MTREEHLAWAKQRALEYVDRGDLPNAVSSMISDLHKHPDFNDTTTTILGQLGVMELMNRSRPEVIRHWIEGFN